MQKSVNNIPVPLLPLQVLHRSKRIQRLSSVQDYVKQHGALGAVFGHSGMVASAEAILQDMEDHGVLQTLLHGEEYQNQE